MRHTFLILILSQILMGTTAKADLFGHSVFSNPPLWHSPSVKSNKEAPAKVGILVPLSGPHKKLGENILNAAMMALYTAPASEIILVPVDSGNSEEMALSATATAIEQGCDLIIGPVFAKQVRAVKRKIPSHINLISFSNDVSVAGNNIFVAGYSPHEQTQFVLQTLANKGLSEIIALLPDNAYGKEVGAVFSQVIQDIFDEAPRIYFYDIEGVSDEFLNELTNVIKESPPQAIYVPDGSRKTLSLVSKLKYKGINTQETLIVGSSDWNKPMFINDYGLKGALFPETKLPTSNAFTKEFQGHFSHAPDVLAEIAYDLVMMAVDVYQQHPNLCLQKADITSENGFPGLRGRFHFDQTGNIHRKYTLMEITGNKPKKALEEESQESTLAEKYRNLFEDV